MHQTKRVLSLLLATIMMAAIFVLPASAASEMRVAFGYFPQQSVSSYTRDYTRVVQAYLLEFSDTTGGWIRNAGGMDGVYGNATKQGVEFVQGSYFGTTRTGVCDSGTWALMGDSMLSYGSLYDEETQYTYDAYGLWEREFVRTREVGNQTEFSVYNVLYGGWTVFRRA